MKKYNKNKYQFNVQLSDGSNDISFNKMWALNQAKNSPSIITNPLAQAYDGNPPSFGVGGIMQGLGGLASGIPGLGIAGSAVSMAGGLIDAFSKPTAVNPSIGYANRNPYGMASGGDMEPLSPDAMEVTGGQGQLDGNQINYKGQPINVDHGEVIDHKQDIVFSDRLFDPRSGKSFADSVKPLEKLIGKLSKTPSTINNKTVEMLQKQKQKIFQTQEQVATAMGQRNQDGSTVQPGQPAMAMGGRMNYVTGGDPGKNEFQYEKGYEGAASYDFRPENFYKTSKLWLKLQEGQKWEREQRAANPKYKQFNPDNRFGKNHYELASQPGFQDMYKKILNPSKPVDNGMKPPEGTIPQLDPEKGFTGYKKPTSGTPYSDFNNETKAAIVEQKYQNMNEPSKWDIYRDKTNKPFDFKRPYGLGDYMQLGAAGASVLGALLDRPEKQRARLDQTQITPNRFDPANALMQNQYSTNAAAMANSNNYSSAGVQSGLQNLYANKYRADSQVQQHYDEMNQNAMTQYEQRKSQQNQFNSQVNTQVDNYNAQNRAAYTNNLYGALHSVAGVGKGFSDRETTDNAIRLYTQNNPNAQFLFNSDGTIKSMQAGNPVFVNPDEEAIKKKKEVTTTPPPPLTTNGWSGGKITKQYKKRK